MPSSPKSAFIVHGQDVQIDPLQVQPGDLLLLALKNEVKPGAKLSRLIAKYDTIKVNTPDACWSEGEEHTTTVCTQCIQGSWLWDYLFRNIRTLRNFAHGTARAYDYYGCRCTPCTDAHTVYQSRFPGVTYGTKKP